MKCPICNRRMKNKGIVSFFEDTITEECICWKCNKKFYITVDENKDILSYKEVAMWEGLL